MILSKLFDNMVKKFSPILFLGIFLVAGIVFAKPIITRQPLPEIVVPQEIAISTEPPVSSVAPSFKASTNTKKKTTKTSKKTATVKKNKKIASATTNPVYNQPIETPSASSNNNRTEIFVFLLSLAALIALYGFFDSVLSKEKKEKIKLYIRELLNKKK